MKAELLVVSFSSDWLYPTSESKDTVRALQANGIPTTFVEIPNACGHDAFLLPNEQFAETVSGFLANVQQRVRGETAIISFPNFGHWRAGSAIFRLRHGGQSKGGRGRGAAIASPGS